MENLGLAPLGCVTCKELFDSGQPLPASHQIDLHPFMTRTEIVKFCRGHGIVLEAWAAIARAMRFRSSIDCRPCKEVWQSSRPDFPTELVAEATFCAQGFVPLVKSADHRRIVSNADVFNFELDATEIEELDQLDEYLLTDWDPTDCP